MHGAECSGSLLPCAAASGPGVLVGSPWSPARRRRGARIARPRSGSIASSATSTCCSGRSIAAPPPPVPGRRWRRGGQYRNPHGSARSADARPYRAGRGVRQSDRADPSAGRAGHQRCRDALRRRRRGRWRRPPRRRRAGRASAAAARPASSPPHRRRRFAAAGRSSAWPPIRRRARRCRPHGGGGNPNGGGPAIFGTLTPPGAPAAPAAAERAPAGCRRRPEALPTGSAAEQYNHAFGLLKQADYPAAEAALKAFLEQHPTDPMAGNAQYWLGETYYTRNRFLEAASAFAEGYKRYPKRAEGGGRPAEAGDGAGPRRPEKERLRRPDPARPGLPASQGPIRDRAAAEKKRVGCS